MTTQPVHTMTSDEMIDRISNTHMDVQFIKYELIQLKYQSRSELLDELLSKYNLVLKNEN